jgi:hypothetical protein
VIVLVVLSADSVHNYNAFVTCGRESTRPSPTSTCSCASGTISLVETVKGYAAHERATLDEVINARKAAVAAQEPAQRAAAESMLIRALRQFFALTETYSNLKADIEFQHLQAE